jgi:predicted DNA-binding protein (MmcQ/YjbR family)
MNVEEIREYAISKPDVEESFPFGQEFNVKCDPERAIELRDEYECILPGYHMNKKHWNSVIIDGTLTNKKIKEQIDHSYDLVKPKLKRR